jgi:hypothetical protein
VKVAVNVALAALGAILATTLLLFLRPTWERHRRRLLRRMAWRERRRAHRLLGAKLSRAGYRLGWRRRRLSRRQADALRSSIRVRTRAGDALDAQELLRRLRGQTTEVYLLKADAGQGKTTFALTTALQRTSRKDDALVPFYFDAAGSGFERKLERWVGRTRRATRDGAGWLVDRALLIFDAINETVEVETLARAIGDLLHELQDNHVKLLLLFSFRQPAYAGDLVAALEGAGVCSMQTLRLEELDAGREEEQLACFSWLVRRRRNGAQSIPEAVTKYRKRHRYWSLSRRDVAILTKWIDEHPGIEENCAAPSPTALVAHQYLNEKTDNFRAELLQIARIAFVMLGDERSACSFERVAGLLERDRPKKQAAQVVDEYMRKWGTSIQRTVAISVETEERQVRIASETAIRVLGALHLANCLWRRATPEMGGRTAYDVVAPYVPEALRWLGVDDPLPAALERHLRDELKRAKGDGRTAPYSFFGRVVVGPYATASSSKLRMALFRSIIDVLDRNRACTCAKAIRNARSHDMAPRPDPVLDQLFELMSGCGEDALESLLALTSDGAKRSLVRSQAAYLLLAWIQMHGVRDAVLWPRIAKQLGAGASNLHLRYHQAELLAKLFDAAAPQPAPDAVRQAAKAVWAAGPAPGTTVSPAYELLSRAVSDYVRHLLDRDSGADGVTAARFRCEALHDLWGARTLQAKASPDPLELQLECWEVALGLSGKAFRHAGAAERQLSEAIIAALQHKLWIVRWFAFGNLVELFEWAADDTSEQHHFPALAATFADQIVAQIFCPDEPIGLKQRECAFVESLLARHDSGSAWEHLRAEIRSNGHCVVEKPGRNAFTNSYARALGQPAEYYVAEYFGRVDRLLAQAL